MATMTMPETAVGLKSWQVIAWGTFGGALPNLIQLVRRLTSDEGIAAGWLAGHLTGMLLLGGIAGLLVLGFYKERHDTKKIISLGFGVPALLLGALRDGSLRPLERPAHPPGTSAGLLVGRLEAQPIATLVQERRVIRLRGLERARGAPVDLIAIQPPAQGQSGVESVRIHVTPSDSIVVVPAATQAIIVVVGNTRTAPAALVAGDTVTVELTMAPPTFAQGLIQAVGFRTAPRDVALRQTRN